MTVRARIENLVRELLPPGRFWEGPEAERLVAGIAGALFTPATTIDGLFDAIQPETASIPVLRQYYDYLRGSLDCVAIPSDEEDLRAAVVQLFRAEFAASAAGMAAMIKGFLPLVEIRESQETSTLPKTLPLVLEPTGRIYEIWYPSLQNSASQVECVARRYMRDGDALRMVTPNAELVVTGSTAAETLFTWVHGIPATLVVERALTEGGPTVEQASLAVATDSGTVSLSDLFTGLEPADNANAIKLRWWFERDYGEGPIQITPTQNRGIVNEAHVIFETVTGLAPTYLWVGSPIDAASGEFLTAVGSPESEVAVSGLVEGNGISEQAFRFDDGENEAWRAAFSTIGDPAGSIAYFVLFRSRTTTAPTSTRTLVDKSDTAGINISILNGGTIQGRLRCDSLRTRTLTSLYFDAEWHLVCIWTDSPNLYFYAESDLDAATSTFFSGQCDTTQLLQIGFGGGAGAADVEVAMVAICEGAQVEQTAMTTEISALMAHMVA